MAALTIFLCQTFMPVNHLNKSMQGFNTNNFGNYLDKTIECFSTSGFVNHLDKTI